MYIPTSNVEEIVNEIGQLSVPKNKTTLIFLSEQQLPYITHLTSELKKKGNGFLWCYISGTDILCRTISYLSNNPYSPLIQKPILIQNIIELANGITSSLISIDRSYKNKPTAFIIVDSLSP